MTENVTPFPTQPQNDPKRPTVAEYIPPLSRTLIIMTELARATRRQAEMAERFACLKALARLTLPTISPAGTRALKEIRGALIEELTHEPIPNADAKTTDLLSAVAQWLREEGSHP